MVAEYELTYEDDGCRVATFRSVVVSAWRAAPNIARLRAVTRAADTLKHLPPPAGAFSVVVPRPSLTFDATEAIRAAAAGNFQRYRGTDLSSAFAIEGSGFVTATMRSLLSGVLMVARPTYPIRVFPTREDAAAWFVPRTQNAAVPGFDAAQLLAVVDALFAPLA